MGRKVKMGLDYFPVDVDLFSDIKIRKLIRRQGGKAVAVYALLLCFIYKNGYYIGGDEELPFIISETLGFDEAYIQEVINSCFSLGLFDGEIYSRYNVITSAGIQSRYREISSQIKRKARIDEYNLLDNIGVSSEVSVVSSEEMVVSSEDMPITSESMQQKKEKEIKGNKNKEIKKKIDNSFNEEIQIIDCIDEMKHDQAWRETVVMNRHQRYPDFSFERLNEMLDEFVGMQSERKVTSATRRDIYEYFSNWLNIKLKTTYHGNINPREATGGPVNRRNPEKAGVISSPDVVQL
jgi:hypothetical protein